jgi:ketosteroid isomerase-like protein
MDTHREMPEESTRPDLVELTRGLLQAADRGDFDAALRLSGPDAVWDMSPWGMGTHEGPGAIRGLNEDWFAAYEEWEIEPEEIRHLGNGVVFGVFSQHARVAGSTSYVCMRQAAVVIWVDGEIARLTMYPIIDEARAAGERLAREREQAVSQANLDLVYRWIRDRQMVRATAFLHKREALKAVGLEG